MKCLVVCASWVLKTSEDGCGVGYESWVRKLGRGGGGVGLNEVDDATIGRETQSALISTVLATTVRRGSRNWGYGKECMSNVSVALYL